MVVTEPAVASAWLLGLGSKLYPSNMPRMLNKDLTRFVLSLYWVRQNRANGRKALLIGWFHGGSMIGYVPDQRSRSRYSSASYLTCSRLSDSGEDAKEKGTRKVGGAGKRKRKGERPCNHNFYDPLPPTFRTFEIIRFWLSNCWNANELESFSNFSRDHFANPLLECEQSGV